MAGREPLNRHKATVALVLTRALRISRVGMCPAYRHICCHTRWSASRPHVLATPDGSDSLKQAAGTYHTCCPFVLPNWSHFARARNNITIDLCSHEDQGMGLITA